MENNKMLMLKQYLLQTIQQLLSQCKPLVLVEEIDELNGIKITAHISHVDADCKSVWLYSQQNDGNYSKISYIKPIPIEEIGQIDVDYEEGMLNKLLISFKDSDNKIAIIK